MEENIGWDSVFVMFMVMSALSGVALIPVVVRELRHLCRCWRSSTEDQQNRKHVPCLYFSCRETLIIHSLAATFKIFPRTGWSTPVGYDHPDRAPLSKTQLLLLFHFVKFIGIFHRHFLISMKISWLFSLIFVSSILHSKLQHFLQPFKITRPNKGPKEKKGKLAKRVDKIDSFP